MIKALRLQVPNTILFGNANLTGLVGNLTNLRNRDTVYRLWQSRDLICGDGKQEFEVFAAVERQQKRVQCAAATESGDERIDGKARGFNQHADLAFPAKVMK